MQRATSNLFIIILLSSFLISRAQTPAPTRPKIGYVLSGGGARGMAHVGVLKVLEEVGLAPDYITGTSMGSIMGGLYSIGYSADEIGEVIETVDWSTVLTNEIPSDKVIMRRKHSYNRFMVTLPIYGRKIELPSGLIEGQELSQLFSELTWPQAGVSDFNDFPSPFSCIGTDILRGEMVEMNSGDLSSAMRASMAIPSVFTPVIRDSSHILVDGGVMRNFPVEEVINMGADIVIGVYVGFENEVEPEQLRSMTSIITRTSLLSGGRDVQAQMPLVDYLILPDLGDYTSSSFTSGVGIMNMGEAAAREQIEILKALADSVNSLGPPPPKKKLPKNDSILVTEIAVPKASPNMEKFIVNRSGIQVGEWITPSVLNEGIEAVFGTLFFDKIGYFFEKLEEGYRLVFDIKEKPDGALGTALYYDNEFGPGLILNFVKLNSFIEGSRLDLTADLGDNIQFKGYYDIHLGKKRNTISSLIFRGARAELPFISNNVVIGNYGRNYAAGGVGIRQILKINNQVGAELLYGYSSLKLSKNIKEILPALEFLDNFIISGLQLKLDYQNNTFNNYLYPTRGNMAEIIFRQSIGTRFVSNYDFPDSLLVENKEVEYYDPYWSLSAEFQNYLPLGDYVSLNSGISVGISQNERPFTDNFYMGGYKYNLRTKQVPFVGLHTGELETGNYATGKLGLQVNPISKLFVTLLANVAFISDDISSFWDDILGWETETRYFGAGAGFTYRTPIGPLSVFLGSRTDTWNPIWYTTIGFTF